MTQLPLEYHSPVIRRTDAPRIADRYLTMLMIVLAGYALDGRAFAYIGYPPIFIGELTLLVGIIALINTPRWSRMFNTLPALCLLPFMAWGLARTLPYVSPYGMDAFRDAAVWAYSLFGFCIAGALLAEPKRLNTLLHYYNRFTRVFLAAVPFVWAIAHFIGGALPGLPWASVPIITIKEGDVLVHLAGIIAFWASGLGPVVEWRWIILMTFDLCIAGTHDRGGLLSFLFVLVVCFVLRPRALAPWRLGTMIAIGLVILAVTGVSIEVPGGKGRPISFAQLVENVFSVGSSSKASGLDATKEWRMNWWTEIIHYTVHGPYFWGGKGYGINIANDDGFQVESDGGLRSPHSIHMTYLARSGVAGVSLWALCQLAYGGCIGWAYFTARRKKELLWASMFLFLGCYWSAFLINASFDVFLEGPMGSIWFWTVYGLGFSCLWLYRKAHWVLET